MRFREAECDPKMAIAGRETREVVHAIRRILVTAVESAGSRGNFASFLRALDVEGVSKACRYTPLPGHEYPG